jgi:hypothetical protein
MLSNDEMTIYCFDTIAKKPNLRTLFIIIIVKVNSLVFNKSIMNSDIIRNTIF